MGIKTDILEALELKLKELPWAKSVEWKRIRLMAGDFADHDVPAIQFYAGATNYTHFTGRLEASTEISIELVMMQTSASVVEPQDVMNYAEDIELKIGESPNLGIPGMVHLKYLSDEIDLHTIEPYYYVRLTFAAIYHKRFSGC